MRTNLAAITTPLILILGCGGAKTPTPRSLSAPPDWSTPGLATDGTDLYEIVYTSSQCTSEHSQGGGIDPSSGNPALPNVFEIYGQVVIVVSKANSSSTVYIGDAINSDRPDLAQFVRDVPISVSIDGQGADWKPDAAGDDSTFIRGLLSGKTLHVAGTPKHNGCAFDVPLANMRAAYSALVGQIGCTLDPTGQMDCHQPRIKPQIEN